MWENLAAPQRPLFATRAAPAGVPGSEPCWLTHPNTRSAGESWSRRSAGHSEEPSRSRGAEACRARLVVTGVRRSTSSGSTDFREIRRFPCFGVRISAQHVITRPPEPESSSESGTLRSLPATGCSPRCRTDCQTWLREQASTNRSTVDPGRSDSRDCSRRLNRQSPAGTDLTRRADLWQR